MNRKQRKELRERQSTRQLMGIGQLTEHGVETAGGELAFFMLRPDNLSVLSPEGVRERVSALADLLRSTPELRLLALDSRASFRPNQLFYRRRLEEERLPGLRELLLRDAAHLDSIQASTASAREFLLAIPAKEDDAGLRQMEKSLRDRGFRVRLAERQDVKRLLAAYYQQDAPDRFPESGEEPKDFLDMIAPTAVKFNADHAVMGGVYRAFLALRGYPASTGDLALLRHLGEKSGVDVHIYVRRAAPAEEKQIIRNASSRNRLSSASTTDLRQAVAAQSDLQDVAALVTEMHRQREPLVHCAVFLALTARDLDGLRALKDQVDAELIRARLSADPLLLRQREGFLTSNLAGFNAFGAQFERVLPAASAADLYPFNYSGKTDPNGFYIGRDKYGSNIIVDLDRRAGDKTNANVLILGNSGQGKSYLMKLLICGLLESGKSVVCLDPENELKELCGGLGGCFVDLMGGQYRINPLEPKLWADDGGETGAPGGEVPTAFTQSSRLSQHISFLKDFLRAYKDFSDRHVDAIELMLERLYAKSGLDDATDFSRLRPADYPVLSDLYGVIEEAYENYGDEASPLYPKELLREILLGFHSMCRGAESRFFNGHTNVTGDRFLVFGCKGLSDAAASVRNALLFNVLSYLSHRLLTQGNTVAAIDELYLFLANPTAIEYIRGFMKRVRKKDSAVMLSSQNLEDFALPGIAELTRPLFSIPTHQFLFNTGSIEPRFFTDSLQLERSEYELVRAAQRGECLYKCGGERYLLEVRAPNYKEALFGKAGGR